MATAHSAPTVERPRNPLAAKLETVARLPQDDLDALHSLCGDARDMDARRNIIREGDRPDHVHLIVEGWAARYKLLPDGAADCRLSAARRSV